MTMSKFVWVVAALLPIGESTALAQTGPPRDNAIVVPEIIDGTMAKPAPQTEIAPMAKPPPMGELSSSGADLTEAQARQKLEAAGYSTIADLKKDAQSVWRGTAMKDGKTVAVALDRQGHVVSGTSP